VTEEHPNFMQIKAAGLSSGNKMTFCPGICRCGDIHDGVSLDTGRGAWVISFFDFESMYLAAKDRRSVPTSVARND
jgi:hypothetical protein